MNYRITSRREPRIARTIRLLGVLATAGVLLLPVTAQAATTTFGSGSLIIPMDTTYQNYGMWKAYGLVYKLLRSGVPVHWSINPTQSAWTPPAARATDFTGPASGTTDLRTSVAITNSYAYKGGPYIIDSAYAATATPIIQAWWLAQGNQPAVHRVTASFDAPINIVLKRAPLIALEQTNAGIATAYFNAAGIPDSSGNIWTTTSCWSAAMPPVRTASPPACSEDIFNQYRIANGDLFQAGACSVRKYDVFVTPHNGGYSYSLTDPTNLGTRTYAKLDDFVNQGGGWIALCHSILSNENYIYDLLKNGSTAVKSLFKYIQDGNTTASGFLTTNGFASIANGSGTWIVERPNLPIGQAVATTPAQGLPGGSVQTWNHSLVSYLPAVERIAYFQGVGVQYDHAVNGVYHGGAGRGKLSFIGGHSFSTSLPYLANYEAPYLRMFYNALFFNGAAVAKIAIVPSKTSVPQGQSTMSIAIQNTGSSNAAMNGAMNLILPSGVTYVSTTGAQPDVAPAVGSSGTLTWNTPGNIAGGATFTTVNVALNFPSTGTFSIGSIQAAYGDEFAEAFTVRDCAQVTVIPSPALVVTKSPATQTGVLAGSEVEWTLTYANVGNADSLTTVVEDILPAGFTIDVIATAVDDPVTTPLPVNVIPLANGTTLVRWSVGTVAQGSAPGSITLYAFTPTPVTPPQTYTNSVTATGRDSGGNAFTSAPATATVTVIAPKLAVVKSVTPTETTPGNTLTYTVTPSYTDTYPLTNATVVDPIPTNTTYVAGSATASGSYAAGPPASVTWVLGSNDPGVPGISAEAGWAYCPVTVTLPATADTFIDINNATTNYGTNVELKTRPASATRYKHSMIQFDLTSIPSTATVISANLGLTVTGTRTSHVDQVRLMTTSWTENGATWNLRDGTNAWTAGTFSSADYSAASYGAFVPSSTGLKVVPVTEAVKIWVATPALNRGFGLISSGSDGGDAKYGSRTNGTASNQPFLRVVYLEKRNTTCSGTLDAPNIADTYVDKGNQTTNYNASTTLTTDPGNNDTTANTIHSLLQFDVSAIPPGATITSANLSLTVTTNKTNHVDEIHRMISAWTEAGATWTRRDGTNLWASGAVFGTSDYDATTVGTFAPAANGRLTTSVTPLVNQWINGGYPNHGLVLRSTGTDNADAKYASKENTTVASRPALSINWTVPLSTAPGTTNTLSVSPLMITTSGTVTVTMTVRSTGGDVTGVSPPTDLFVQSSGIASYSKITGPLPAGPVTLTSGIDTTFTWTYSVTAGSQPGFIVFSGKPTSTQPSPVVNFVTSNSTSLIVTPSLSYQASVNTGLDLSVNQVQNVATFADDAVGSSNATALTTIKQPMLSLAKSVSPAGTVTPGTELTYTLVLTNSGTGATSNVSVTDAVPANTAYVAASCTPISPGTCAKSGGGTGTITFSGFSVPAFSSVTMSFKVTASSSLAIGSYTLTNVANVTSTEVPTAVPSNTVTNTLLVEPKLTIAKAETSNSTEDALGRVTPGNTITYTVTVTNVGTVAATGVSVTDAVPAGTTYAASPAVTCAKTNPTAACTASFGSGTITGTVGNLAINQVATITFRVTVNSPAVDGSSIVNRATVNCTGLTAPITSNDVSYVIAATPNLTVAKSACPGTNTVPAGSYTQVIPGATITYRLRVKNLDPTATANLIGAYVRDAIPAGTSYVTGSTYLVDPANDVPCNTVSDWPASGGTWLHVDDSPGSPALPVVASNLLVYSFAAQYRGDTPDSGILATGTAASNANDAIIQFRVTVDQVANGTDIDNAAVAGAAVPINGSVTPQYETAPTPTLRHKVWATPNLSISKSVSPTGQVPLSDANGYPTVLTYTLTVTNSGNGDATGVTVTDTIAQPWFVIYPAQVCDGTGCTAALASDGGTYSDGTITWTGLTVPAGGTKVLTFAVNPSFTYAGAWQIDNTASIPVWNYYASALASAQSMTSPSNQVSNTLVVPTLVKMRSMTAQRSGNDVVIEWRTDLETDNLGFNVFREVGGVKAKINRQLIAGSAFLSRRPVKEAGYSYRFRDKLPADAPVQYWIQDVDTHRVETMNGPVIPQLVSKPLPDPTTVPLPGLGSGGAVVEPPAGVGALRPDSLPATTPAMMKVQADLASSAGAKIYVSKEGWYRVSRAALMNAGYDPGPNASKLGVWSSGIEQPIVVNDGGDGKFDVADTIEFYALGIDTISTGARAYWVRNSGSARLATVQPSGTPSSGSGAPFTYEVKPRSVFAANVVGNGDKPNWFGPAIGPAIWWDFFGRATQTLGVASLDGSFTGNARLELTIQGGTDGPHAVDVVLTNGAGSHFIGTAHLAGIDQKSFAFAFPHSWLTEGENTLQFESTAGEYDFSTLAVARLTYQHALVADEDVFEAALSPSTTYTIAGFRSQNVRVVDVSDPLRPVALGAAVVADGSSFKATFTTPAAASERTILAVSEKRFAPAAEVVANKTASLAAIRSGPDMLILVNPAFAAAATALQQVRRDAGLQVVTVDIEDVYDEFNFGVRSPEAIRNFLETASAWKKPPRFVTLIGDASIDPRDYLALGSIDFVPTKLVDMTTTGQKSASDDWLADFDGDGIADIALGRLPAKSAEEAALMVAKITSRGTPSGAWATRVLFIADANSTWDFEGAARRAAAQLPAGMLAGYLDAGGVASPGAKTVAAFNDGQLMVDFIGHGSQWAGWGGFFGITDAYNLENAKLPFVVAMTCESGYFHDVYLDSMAGAFLRAPRGGAVAVWASSTLTTPDQQELINAELLRQLFGTTPRTIGEAAMRAKRATEDMDVRRSWILFGDPSLSLK